MSDDPIYIEFASDPVEVEIEGETYTIELLGGTATAARWGYLSGDIDDQADLQDQFTDTLAAAAADATATVSAFMSAHLAAVNPHPQYLTAAEGGALYDPLGAAAAVSSALGIHTGLTTTAHGGIVASTDPRLTDARTPLAHAASHAIGVADSVFPTGSALQYLRRNAANLAIEWTADAVAPAAHQLDGALHTVSGLTAGHFLKALSATTFGFAAHGLTASDVGADAAGTAASAVSTHVGLTDPHTQYQKESEKGAALGYCPLDAGGLIASIYMPPIAISDFLGVAASQVAMLLLSGQKGDWCVRSDESKTYMIIAGTGSLITDWQVLYTPAAPVLSVNTLTGAVSLTYTNVGAPALAHTHTGTIDGSKLAQANTHESADTDSAPTALHHTLGTGANNACAGNDGRLSDSRTPTAHVLDGALHTVSGLTAGHILTALTPTTFGFAAPAVADLSAAAILLPTTSARNVIQPSGAAVVPMTFKGFAAQSANLTEWQDSTGATLSSISASGSFGIGTTAPVSKLHLQGNADCDVPVYGVEFLSASGWTSTAWTGSWAAGWTHTVGNTTVLSQSTAAVSGVIYRYTWTVTGRTAGTFVFAFGGLSVTNQSASSESAGLTTSTAGLTITPTSDFDGTIVLSIKRINTRSTPVFTLTNSSGSVISEMRSGATNSYNTFLGCQCGGYTVTASMATGVGYQALNANLTGFGSTAFGAQSLFSNTSGTNSAFGYRSLLYVTTGTDNTACGSTALQTLVSGNFNTAMGRSALYTTTGSASTGIGWSSLTLATGSNNTGVGMSSGRSITSGHELTFLGYYAGYNASQKVDAIDSMALGASSYTTADHQVVIGASTVTQTILRSVCIDNANYSYTQGTVARLSVNPAITVDNAATAQINTGADANKGLVIQGFSATQSANLQEWQTSAGTIITKIMANGDLSSSRGSGAAVCLHGEGAGLALTTGAYNAFFGYRAGYQCTTSTNSAAFGAGALGVNVTGNACAAFGAYALNENTAAANTGIGALAGRRNTSGGANTSVGSGALTNVTTGSFNTGVGAGAGQTNQTGAYNCAFGYNSLYNATGGSNHAFGANALLGLTTGANNIGIGYSAGRYIADDATLNTTGSQSIFIGDTSKANADGEANQTVIGYLATGAGANSVTLGNTSVTTTVLRGNVRLGAVEGTSATQTIALANGTAPSTSPADAFQMYSADMAAGNAVPHFRTEDGTVVKLSQSLDVVKPVTAAGATPVDSDVTAWGNNSMGVVVGTGGRVFFTFKNAADVYYVEASAI